MLLAFSFRGDEMGGGALDLLELACRAGAKVFTYRHPEAWKGQLPPQRAGELMPRTPIFLGRGATDEKMTPRFSRFRFFFLASS